LRCCQNPNQPNSRAGPYSIRCLKGYSRPFSAITLPLPAKVRAYKEGIIKLSREKYSKSRTEVEREILFLLNL